MTATADERRAKSAQRLLIATAVAVVLALGVTWRDSQARKVTGMSGPFFPDWPAVADQAQVMTVTSATDTFTIEKTEDGWRLAERGGYPVSADALRVLDGGLIDLSFRARKTADPERLDRLGLGDPSEGGRGVRLEITGAEGETLLAAILGDDRPGGGLYARFADSNQSYIVEGALPDLDNAADWIEVDFLDLDNADIASARVEPAEGEPYELTRAEPSELDYVLAEPAEGWTLLTLGAGNAVGGALANLRFDDVRPANELEGEPAARHVASTFDGLEVALDVYAEPGAHWAVVSSTAIADSAVLDAAALNARTDGWAYRMPIFAADRLIRPLSDIASTGDEEG